MVKVKLIHTMIIIEIIIEIIFDWYAQLIIMHITVLKNNMKFNLNVQL